MGKALIIVESPTKIKTLKKFFGDAYLYESSVGHIRDLPEKGFGIDVDNNFQPEYQVLPGKQEVVDKLKRAAKKVDLVYLCPDPDREGEAIAWHIASLLPPDTKTVRATFQSMTKDAVEQGLGNPRPIDMAQVNAQQARRLLDRMVGYKISPLLARRIARGKDGGLSAGRVQSVALKLVVDREAEISRFIPVEYWTIQALLTTEASQPLRAQLVSIQGKKIEKEPIPGKDVALIPNEATAERLRQELLKARYWVDSIERKEKQRHPVAPFITSTLQQEASRHHGFSAQRTMSIAQSLYEGVDLGSAGSEGLITYMRTDSVRVAPEAINEARKYIKAKHGDAFLPSSPRHYSTKKSAQDAHEAIRPTHVHHTPESVRPHLTQDQFHLYQLIWRRFVASQMASAIYDTVSVEIATDKDLGLRSTGSQLKFQGFLILYEERFDDDNKEDSADKLLPFITEKEALSVSEVTSEQSFTRPPPRFTEASLVKELEKSGIGRPSTYATIMNKIQSRDYTTKERGYLKPTELGCLIARMLEENFPLIMQVGFTASMEDQLETIAENQKDWHDVLKAFWGDFLPMVEQATSEMHVPKEETDLICPTCGANLQKIWAKGRYFLGCSRYPDCSYTTTLEEQAFNKADYAEDFDWDQPCPKCQSPMKVRHGRYGPFLGCTNYPECRGIVNIPKKGEKVETSEPVPCPAIGCSGNIQQRRSWRGKVFYSCSEYPACDVIVSQLSQLAEKYVNRPKTPYVAKTKKGSKTTTKSKSTAKKSTSKSTTTKKTKSTTATRAKKGTSTTGLNQPLAPSPALARLLGETPGSRPEFTKRLWSYIKEHQLQDPKDGRIILPDTALKAALGLEGPTHMMQLPKFLSAQLKSM